MLIVFWLINEFFVYVLNNFWLLKVLCVVMGGGFLVEGVDGEELFIVLMKENILVFFWFEGKILFIDLRVKEIMFLLIF